MFFGFVRFFFSERRILYFKPFMCQLQFKASYFLNRLFLKYDNIYESGMMISCALRWLWKLRTEEDLTECHKKAGLEILDALTKWTMKQMESKRFEDII